MFVSFTASKVAPTLAREVLPTPLTFFSTEDAVIVSGQPAMRSATFLVARMPNGLDPAHVSNSCWQAQMTSLPNFKSIDLCGHQAQPALAIALTSMSCIRLLVDHGHTVVCGSTWLQSAYTVQSKVIIDQSMAHIQCEVAIDIHYLGALAAAPALERHSPWLHCD